MSQFEDSVQQFIQQKHLFLPDSRLLVALSGGADSVALLRVLHHLGYTIEAAHCNFHLRGEESLRDEIFVKNLTQKLGIHLHIADFNTEAYAKEHKISIEMAARDLRYKFFNDLCQQFGFNAVCVAHHRDDNAETILLNLIRGTGIKGLTGMHPLSGYIARPLLCTTREGILTYLQESGQDFVTDSTNLKTDFKRNKIRLQLLPLMKTINPSVVETICETAERLKDIESLSINAIESIQEQLLNRELDGSWSISIQQLKEQTSPKTVLYDLLHTIGFTSSQTNNIWKHIDSTTGATFCAADITLLIDRGYLKIKRNEKDSTHLQIHLSIGEDNAFPEGHLTINKETFISATQISRQQNIATIDADKITGPLILRKVMKGDRFQPFGMKGSKLISDYFTDMKLSLFEREKQYVVCSGDKIVWVVGHRIDQHFAIDPNNTHEIIRIELG